jgi:hypothetical protein
VSAALTALLDLPGSTDDVGGYRMLSADRCGRERVDGDCVL